MLSSFKGSQPADNILSPLLSWISFCVTSREACPELPALCVTQDTAILPAQHFNCSKGAICSNVHTCTDPAMEPSAAMWAHALTLLWEAVPLNTQTGLWFLDSVPVSWMTKWPSRGTGCDMGTWDEEMTKRKGGGINLDNAQAERRQ